MAVFYVFQGETYDQERPGGYVWAPKLNRNGGKNAGYSMMTNIRKGDFILHNVTGKVVSISIAQTDYYEAKEPHELVVADTSVDWDEAGYRVDTDYFDFDVPLLTITYKEWLEEHYIEAVLLQELEEGNSSICAIWQMNMLSFFLKRRSSCKETVMSLNI